MKFHIERVAEADRRMEISFGMDCRPADAVFSKNLMVRSTVFIEEIFENLMKKVEEPREVDQLSVIFMPESDRNRSSK